MSSRSVSGAVSIPVCEPREQLYMGHLFMRAFTSTRFDSRPTPRVSVTLAYRRLPENFTVAREGAKPSVRCSLATLRLIRWRAAPSVSQVTRMRTSSASMNEVQSTSVSLIKVLVTPSKQGYLAYYLL